ncbi:MAG: class I SAM-dependent rRNA methyltransferase [Nitrospinae bacterium]|nr:class I SAM-dependent rRNA methyltransferase [Nitrospinota bacterium]
MLPIIKLKSGRENSAVFGHPWIFSGAVAERPQGLSHGDFITIQDHQGKVVGVGSYSSKGSIMARIFDFSGAGINKEWFAAKIRRAESLRRLMGYGPGTNVTGYRVVFGEADGIPGLIVDRYAETVVFTLSTAGLDKKRAEIVEALDEALAPSAIVERSDSTSRKDEGLEEAAGVIKGSVDAPVEFVEHGVKFLSDALEGQKTGFFLDQKDLRAAIRRTSSGRRVLNLFSYTGAASVYAMLGGASSVHNVDGSQPALDMALRNARLNGLAEESFTNERSDVFQWLNTRREPEFDMVIVDPPSIIKSAKDTESGKKAYHFLNRAAIRLVKDDGILATSSCSQHLSGDDFAFILRRAAAQAGAKLGTIGSFSQSADHPISVHFPESFYLKSFMFEVRR